MITYRTLSLFLPLALVLPVAAGEKASDAEAQAQAVAPYLDEQTIAVVHLDMARLDGETIAEKLLAFTKAQAEELTAIRQAVGHWITAFAKAGGKDIYAVFSLADMPDHFPFLIVPLEGEANIKALAGLFEAKAADRGGQGQMVPWTAEVSEKLDHVLFAGSRAARARLGTLKAIPRPDLAKAFAAVRDAAFQILLVTTADTRRVVAETLPPLASEGGGGPGPVLAHGVVWAALGLDLAPKASLRLVVQSEDAGAAKTLQEWTTIHLKKLTEQKAILQLFPHFQQLAGKLAPEVAGDRLTLTVDDSTLAAVLPPLAVRIRETTRRSMSIDNLKRIGLAMHTYRDANKVFPTQAKYDEQGKPLLSWRVLILPYLGEEGLYREFHLDESWDSDHNKKLIDRIPQAYRAGWGSPAGKTTYLGAVGDKAMFGGRQGLSIRDVPDGTSNTIWVVDADADRAVIWTQPEDLRYNPEKPWEGLGGGGREGFLSLFVDGSAHFLPRTVDAKTLAALFTRNGGEVVKLP